MRNITIIALAVLSIVSCKKEEVKPDIIRYHTVNEPCITQDTSKIIGHSIVSYTYRNYRSKSEGEAVGYFLTVNSTGHISPLDTSIIFNESTEGVHKVTIYHYKDKESVTFYVNDVDGSELTTTVVVDVGDSIDWEVVQ